MSSNSLLVTKSDLYGAKSGTYFEFPELITGPQNTLYCPEDFRDRMITKVAACVGVGIYSIILNYQDGCVSPLLGKRETNTEADLLPGEVRTIRVKHWSENYVQALMMMDPNQNVLGSLESQGGKDQFDDCQIPDGQKVIGIYGYYDKK